MTGASLLHLLAPARAKGMKVALIDRQEIAAGQPMQQVSPSFDGRATALSWGSSQLLRQMNIWQHIAPHACAIEHIQVSDRGRFGQTHLHASEQQTEALGYIIENAHIGQGLLSGLTNQPVQLYPNTVVETAQITAKGPLLTLVSGKQIQAGLLVLADGARSPLAKSLGIEHQKVEYNTTALVTQVEVDKHHRHWAYERFNDSGPIAFLPLRRREFAVVWTLSNDQLNDYLNAPDFELIEELQSLIGLKVGRIERMGTRHTYPLSLLKSREQVRSGLVLLGNAAHSLHPVAGQGFNLALRDTAALAESLLEGFEQGCHPGDLNRLQAYEQKQSQDQHNTILASDLLPKVFSHSGLATTVGRDTGLLALSALPDIRRVLTRHAMGLGQRAARLSQLLSRTTN